MGFAGAIKGGRPLYNVVVPFPVDNYAMVAGKQTQRTGGLRRSSRAGGLRQLSRAGFLHRRLSHVGYLVLCIKKTKLCHV
jgi:hypothetical protein